MRYSLLMLMILIVVVRTTGTPSRRHQTAQSKYSIVGTWRVLPGPSWAKFSAYHINFGIYTFSPDGTYTYSVDYVDSRGGGLRLIPSNIQGTYKYQNVIQTLEVERVEIPFKGAIPIHHGDSHDLYWQDSNHFTWPNLSLFGGGGNIQLERAPGGFKYGSGLSLSKATTKDASSIMVDYTITGSVQSQPIDFKVYRSSSPDISQNPNGGILIGDVPDATPSDLSPGSHSVILLKGTDLPPDAKRPYVIVIGSTATGKSTTYFREWLYGAVVHGYAGLFPSDWPNTYAWAKQMANELITYDHFDQAIALDWVAQSWLAAPGKTKEGGDLLYQKVASYVSQKEQQHAGDIVNIHLIGHSRGTIVVSEALSDLSRTPLHGCFVEVTLLDIHPATTSSDGLWSAYGSLGGSFALKVNEIDQKDQDNQVTLPSGAGIQSIDVWCQRTLASTMFGSDPAFKKEGALNLWGQSENDNHITNMSGIPIQWTGHDLTSPPQTNNPVGHEEVHVYYLDHVVRSGTLH